MTVLRFATGVCFNHKHNEANGEENRDGTNNNYSNNHGKEGLGGTLDLVERRRDSIHALLTTLLLSQGTPMLLAGDEHGHSQHGNNNAYCQDNQLTWLDWSQASSGLTAFTAAFNHLLQAHSRFDGESLVGRRRRQCPLAKSICSTFKHG